MSSANLEIVFEGPAVKAGTIEARVLGDALIGCSEVFARANSIVNGTASDATVLVQSEFKSGSFRAGLELVQVTDPTHLLITAHHVLNAAGLAALIGFLAKNKDSLIDLFKLFKGKKPETAVQVGNNVELTLGQNKKTVNNFIFNMYGDKAIREGFGKLTNPLRETAIDRITVKQDGADQAIIEKSEVEYFDAEPLELEASESDLEGQHETVLVVSKLSFVEGSTWTFLEKGSTLVAKIEDEEFWRNIHQHNFVFGEGDRLRVLLHWKVVQGRNNKLVPKNTILKVYEVLSTPTETQLRLDGDQGKTLNLSGKRKIRPD